MSFSLSLIFFLSSQPRLHFPSLLAYCCQESNFHFWEERGDLHFKKLFTWHFIAHCWRALWILIEAKSLSDKQNTQKATASNQHVCGRDRAPLCRSVNEHRCVHVNPQPVIWHAHTWTHTQKKKSKQCSTDTRAKAHLQVSSKLNMRVQTIRVSPQGEQSRTHSRQHNTEPWGT